MDLAKEGYAISFNSYPRCGNSLIRTVLQQVTGISSGSDTNVALSCLLQNDFKAEEHTGDSVMVVRSHYPMQLSILPPYKANKILIAVRNPFDCFVSWLHLEYVRDHETKLPGKFWEVRKEFFKEYIIKVTQKYKYFYHFMINLYLSTKQSLYFIRFEDATTNKYEVFKGILQYIFNEEDISGMNIHSNLKEVIKNEERTLAENKYCIVLNNAH